MVAETQALVVGFDNACVVPDLLQELIVKSIQIRAYVDRRTLFNLVAIERY